MNLCRACRTELVKSWSFCPSCGAPVTDSPTAAGAESPSGREARAPLPEVVLAERLEGKALSAARGAGFVVRPGCRAFVYESGAYLGSLAAGQHGLSGILRDRPLERLEAILVEDGEFAVPIRLTDLESGDGYRAELDGALAVRLSEPSVFLANVLHGAARVTSAELAAQLGSDLDTVARPYFRARTSEALRTAPPGELEITVLTGLSSPLGRAGLTGLRLRAVSVRIPALDEIDGLQRNITQIEGRRPLLEKLMAAQNLERLSQLKGAEEWRRFRLDVDRQQLLDDSEWKALQASLEASGAEEGLRRRYAHDTLQATLRADLDDLETRRRQVRELSQARHGAEIGRIAGEGQMEKLRAMQELHDSTRERAARREREDLSHKARLDADRMVLERDLFAAMDIKQVLAFAVLHHPERAAEIGGALRAVQAGEATERERVLYDRMFDELRRDRERDHERVLHQIDAPARQAREEVVAAKPTWVHCAEHDLRHRADAACPLCAAEARR